MKRITRRSALVATAAASAAVLTRTPTTAQTMSPPAGTDTTVAPGVVQRAYGGGPALIPGFKTVSMRDIIIQPGANTGDLTMKNAMVCHVPEGELRVVQNGKQFTAKKNDVWTCAVGTKEQTYNDGKVVAVMRVTDLLA